MKCKYTAWVAMMLTVIGALNWGLWGFFQFDLVAWLFHGNTSAMSRVVYAIIGIAGLMSIKRLCCCKSKCSCGCSCCKDKTSCCGK
ncbi:MAG: DUF378 domain-containing protein [Chlamydiae bacterium]|nr:DUF378 domain-containing protein [Chlamydiota bacterium]